MRLFDWRDKKWRGRVMAVLTVVVIVLLASHPELRLMIPLVDSLGLDLLLVLMSAQILDLCSAHVTPLLHWLHRNLLPPLARKAHYWFPFFYGSEGQFVTARIALFLYSRKLPAAA
jgi:hypothetical protein